MRSSCAAAVVLALFVAACSGGVSVKEYADDVEALVQTMNARLDALDAAIGDAPTLEGARRYARERVDARFDFVAGMQELEPPDEVADLHGAAIDILGRVAEAEAKLAERVEAMESTVGLEAIWETPEGIAARTVDAEAVALCQAAQADLDRTQERAQLEGVPWIPREMREVVNVAFGCLASER